MTLLIQGLTLPVLISKSGLFGLYDENDEEETRQKIKHGLRQHIYKKLKHKYENGHSTNASFERIMKHWEDKVNENDENWMSEESKKIFYKILESQREYLTELNQDPKIDETFIRQQLYQIDLEEERIKSI